jgi:hypothetical protein
MKEKWFLKGIHHYFIGHGLTFLALIGVGIDIFFINSYTMAFICSGFALLGQGYAWDDLIGDFFKIKTPIKIIDQWLKKNWGFWFYLCKKIDKLFGKEE